MTPKPCFPFHLYHEEVESVTIVAPCRAPENLTQSHAQTLSGPDLLIREARQRRRRRRWFAGVVALIILVGAFLTYWSARSTPMQAQVPVRTSQARPVLHEPPSLAGPWDMHTFGLTIDSDGHGVFEWPDGVWCGRDGFGTEPQPCDRFVPAIAIIDGKRVHVDKDIVSGHATLRLTSIATPVAHGVIRGSTVPDQVPDGPVTLRATKNDLLYVSFSTPSTGLPLLRYLCGKRAAAMDISQQRAHGFYCGA